jgi:hypothetical protein
MLKEGLKKAKSPPCVAISTRYRGHISLETSSSNYKQQRDSDHAAEVSRLRDMKLQTEREKEKQQQEFKQEIDRFKSRLAFKVLFTKLPDDHLIPF